MIPLRLAGNERNACQNVILAFQKIEQLVINRTKALRIFDVTVTLLDPAELGQRVWLNDIPFVVTVRLDEIENGFGVTA